LVPVTATVNGPTPPTANGITINCGDPATLTASGSTGNYEWFSDANGNNSIGTGNSTSLGNLYADSTVYVAATTSTQTSGSDIYNIDLGDLVGLGSGNNNTRYTCGPSGQGFQWTDASPAGATITSITLEFKIGVECQPGNKNSALNGAAQPNFNSAANHCSTASPGPGSFITMNLTPAAYSVGGNNIFTTSGHGSCFGLERSATLSNYFARVTVNYTYGAQGCQSSLVPVTTTVVPSPGVTVTGTTQICSSNTTTLNASGTSVQWYSDANGTNVVGTGNNFTTPALTANTTYYAGEASTSNSGTYDQTIQVFGGSGLSGSTAFSFPGTPTGATGSPTLTITSYGDIDGTGGNLEQWRVDDENGALAGLAGGLGYGQCSATATTVVNVTTADIDAWAANGTINFTGVDPTGNINYTLCGGDYLQLQLTYNYATGSPCAQQLTQVDITVDQPSTAATSISGVGSTCLGTTSTLSVQGGTLNGTSTWQWFSGNCTGTPLGTGTSISVTPSSTTTYFVSASGSGACPATACASGVVTLPTPSNTLSLNAETGTCPVNQGGYIHLLTSTGRLVASINSNGQNLGDVTATSYLETSPLLVDNCNNIGNPYWQVSVDNRHWVITTTIAPSAPVEVLLPTTDAEWQQLQANAFNNGNPNDDIFNGLTDVGCTKYSGPNENANFPDNCGQGGAFTWHSQTSNGNINAMAGLTGHAATDKYITVNVNSFSEFWLHGSSTSSPLPVELTSYAANCVQDGTVRLKWTTASESESSHFTVERSTNSDDWTLVSQVNAMGHSQSTTLYSVDDELTNRQNVYYRLRQYDLNGDMKDELITSANCIWEDMNQFTVYPNPASSNVQVVLSATVADDQAFIQLSNPEGRTILNQPVKVEKGNNAFHLNLDSLPPGVYLIDLRGERIGLLSSRIVKTD
ncbi:MAG: T9SS type A sorting domain-containing protein, partial [Crocinitomicaceae bacterium]|nr:T9SS type A sorting domain-containing protein [Crocinitomicaceae bacterium]